MVNLSSVLCHAKNVNTVRIYLVAISDSIANSVGIACNHSPLRSRNYISEVNIAKSFRRIHGQAVLRIYLTPHSRRTAHSNAVTDIFSFTRKDLDLPIFRLVPYPILNTNRESRDEQIYTQLENLLIRDKNTYFLVLQFL